MNGNIAEVDGKTLVIRLPLQKPVPSKSSGKTLAIATTHGTVTSDARYNGRRIVVVANAFIYPTRGKETKRQPSKGTDRGGAVKLRSNDRRPGGKK
jgi:hypothetical protein